MAILPILEVPDPVLRQTSAPVEAFDDELRALVADLFETMYDAPGIGLAAIQVGRADRVLVIDLQERDEEGGDPVRRPLAFVNPELTSVGDERILYNEGCLSIPDQYGEVERPAVIDAVWHTPDGERQEGRFDGLMAICLQHEVDHLNGVLFTDHLSRLKRTMLYKRLEKARRLD